MTKASERTVAPLENEHRWSDLDPLVKFGVALAGILFCLVVLEACLLVPYALISHGWTPGH